MTEGERDGGEGGEGGREGGIHLHATEELCLISYQFHEVFKVTLL